MTINASDFEEDHSLSAAASDKHLLTLVSLTRRLADELDRVKKRFRAAYPPDATARSTNAMVVSNGYFDRKGIVKRIESGIIAVKMASSVDVSAGAAYRMYKEIYGYDEESMAKYSIDPTFERYVKRLDHILSTAEHLGHAINRDRERKKTQRNAEGKAAVARAGSGRVVDTQNLPPTIMGMQNPATMSKRDLAAVHPYTTPDLTNAPFHTEVTTVAASTILPARVSAVDRRLLGRLITKLTELKVQHNLSICYAAVTGVVSADKKDANPLHDVTNVLVTNDTRTIAWSSLKPNVLMLDISSISTAPRNITTSNIKRFNAQHFVGGHLQSQEAVEKAIKKL